MPAKRRQIEHMRRLQRPAEAALAAAADDLERLLAAAPRARRRCIATSCALVGWRRSGVIALAVAQKRGRSGKRQLAAMDVQAAELGAAVQLREHLAGIEQPVGIEGAFEALLLARSISSNIVAHQVALLDADAVLAGQHAADLDAEPQDVGAECLGPLELARLVGVVEDQRMQIAVAGMEDIGDAQPVLLRQLAHPRQHLGRRPRGIVPSMQ